MIVTLYLPECEPEIVTTVGFSMLLGSDEIEQDTTKAASLLGCALGLVDILACGTGYLVYSVFDYEIGPVNTRAMDVVSRLTGVAFEMGNEDEEIQGPVLVVQR